MEKEIIFPEFIAESDEALILVLPTLKEELSELFSKFHGGEEIDYWFSWELVMVDSSEFLVVLEIDWEEGTGIVVGFTTEMWEIFRSVTSKQDMVLMSDYELILNGISDSIDTSGDFKPYALLIRNAKRGMVNLLEQAEELETDDKQQETVNYLFEVLNKIFKEKYLLH
ncbi:MAG: hypothetical protein FH758_13140 [Firmicutes bacterium]|nr:hypothetical protein [Bacillota bacterium]